MASHVRVPISEIVVGDYVVGYGTVTLKQKHKRLPLIRLSFDSNAVWLGHPERKLMITHG